MYTHCTILIVNWNSSELLSRCLDALSRQTYRDFKVFVADNASEQPIFNGIFSILPDLVFVQNSSNYGFAEANNRLLELAKDSEWVILLNPDAFPEKDWLEQLINAANEYPEFSCFGSRLLMYENPSFYDGDGDKYHISGMAWREGHKQKVSSDSAFPREIFSACAAAAMYRTGIIEKVGGFDKDFFCYFEDVDIGFRLRLAGYRFLLVPPAVVYHHGSATSGGQNSEFAVYYGHRNLIWTYIKNMPGILFWLFLPLHVFLNIFTLILFSVRGQKEIILKSKKDAIKEIKAVWRKRQKIQSNRKTSILDILHVLDKHPIPKVGRFLSSLRS